MLEPEPSEECLHLCLVKAKYWVSEPRQGKEGIHGAGEDRHEVLEPKQSRKVFTCVEGRRGMHVGTAQKRCWGPGEGA